MIGQAKHTIQIAAKDFTLLLNNKTERDQMLGDDNSDLDVSLIYTSTMGLLHKMKSAKLNQKMH